MKEKREKIKNRDESNNFGLGVAQIVITAATPMEEVEHHFPEPEEAVTKKGKNEIEETLNEDSLRENTSEKSELKENINTEVKIQRELSNSREEVEETSVLDDLPADSAPFPVSSSSGSEEAESTSGPSTTENSQSFPLRVIETETEIKVEVPEIISNKITVGGRASIPDELQPDQLKKLENIKESNA